MRSIVSELPDSLIRAVANAAMGKPGLIPLWFGESDRPTAPEVVAAAQESLARGDTFYGPNLGLPALREAIAAYQRRHFDTRAESDHIAVTSSALNAILLLLSAIVDPGDEVVIPSPAWPNLAAIPKVLGARVRDVPIRLEGDRFVLDVDALIGACGPRTRAVILNSPHNPTGWRLPQEDMVRLVGELDRRGIWLIADEVYSRIVDEGVAPLSFLTLFGDDARVLIVNSFSKAWAMTGWRLGWITAPRKVIGVLERLIEFNTSCAPAFVQHGGVAALGPAGDAFTAAQQERLARSKQALIDVLATDSRIVIPRTRATFYLFPRIEGLTDSVALAHRAASHGVGIAPGEAFGAASRDHVRLCFAREPEEITEAARRLLEALDDTA